MKIAMKKESDKKFEIPPEGTFVGVVYQVVDNGTHPKSGQYALDANGNQRFVRSLDICWEIPEEKMSDGRPFAVFRNLPASLNEKSGLYKLLKPWLGEKALEDFDTASLVGRGCLINIVHSKDKNDPNKTWANVGGVLPLPKGQQAPKPTNEAFSFSIDEWDEELFAKLPQWKQDKIKDSLEFKNKCNEEAVKRMQAEDESGIPF